ncbi:MAG: SpoIID/LytB domain-containing protein [Myxococcota bacterium]
MKAFILLSVISNILLANLDVRLNIAPPAANFTLKGELTASTSQGAVIVSGKQFDLKADKSGISLNGQKTNANLIKITSPDLIEVGSRKFRKVIEVKQAAGKLSLIHTLGMESYIIGVISSELPSSWPLEVLKAQAIAARTYAVWQRSVKEQLESSVMDQVYHGVQREHPLAKQAVEETDGQVLTFDSKPAHTYFHAACGGHTASSTEAFGGSEPYLKGVSCSYCHDAPTYRWKYELSRQDLNRKLGAKIDNMEPLGESASSRVISFRFKSKPKLADMKAVEVRKALGYDKFRSTLITKHSIGWSKAEFAGRGHGHGVGMCQWGALKMAKLGKTSEQILEHYYPGTEIRKFY